LSLIKSSPRRFTAAGSMARRASFTSGGVAGLPVGFRTSPGLIGLRFASALAVGFGLAILDAFKSNG
jgi:hypothetical protein